MVTWHLVFRVQTNGLKGMELQFVGTHSKSNPTPSYVPLANSSIVLQRGSTFVSLLMLLIIPKRRGRGGGDNEIVAAPLADGNDIDVVSVTSIQLPSDGNTQKLGSNGTPPQNCLPSEAIVSGDMSANPQ